MDHFQDWNTLLKLGLSAFFGATVGMERYLHHRPAGLRTYLLVCVSFTSIAILSETSFLGGFRPDPGRLLAGGLTGIGFLGAGIIIQGAGTVYGLTTAAGIWAISMVGLAVGLGSYYLATVLYLLILFSLTGLRYVESFLTRDIYKLMKLQMGSPGISQEELESHYLGKGIRVITVDVSQDRTAKTISYGFTLVGKVEQSFHEVYRELASREDVQSIQLISVD